MTDTSFDRAAMAPATTQGDAAVYRLVFLVLFAFAVPVVFIARAFGRRFDGTVWQEARQSAHATAGYTFQC